MVVGDHEVDLAAVMQRTRYTFQHRGDKLVGGDRTYAVAVDGGEIAFHPDDPRDTTDGVAPAATPLRLKTTAFGRAGATASEPSAFALDEHGHLLADVADGIRERLETRPNGVEQSWELDDKPAGNGDLVVRIATSGQGYVTTTASGLHFRDPTSGLGVAYGHATWKDADGTETTLLASIEGSEIVLRVPGMLVEASAYPAILDPVIGPELAVDTPVVGPAVQAQAAPAVGHSYVLGKEFLVVWEDYRRLSDLSLGFDLYATHVSSNGTVVSPVGFLFTDAEEGGDHRYPSIRANDSYFLVAYSYKKGLDNRVQVRAIPTGSTATPTMSAQVRLDNVNGTPPCTNCGMTDITNNLYFANPAYSWYVAWIDQTTARGRQYYFSFIGGTLSFTAGTLNSVPGAVSVRVGSSTPSTIGVANKFLMVLDTGAGAIHCRFYDKDGIMSGVASTILFSGGNYSNPSVDFYGATGTWLVAADREAAGPGDRDIYAREVNSTTGTLYPVTVIASGSFNQAGPVVAGHGSSGTQAMIAWQEGGPPGSVRAVRVTSGAGNVPTLVGSSTIIGGSVNIGRGPIAAHSDDVHNNYFLAWNDFRSNPSDFAFGDIYGARYSFAGTVLDPNGFLISKSATKQTTPTIRRCGSTYLVAWSEVNDNIYNANIYGSILSSTGTVLYPHIAISTAAGNQTQPAITCNGTDYYVVWEDARNGNPDIYGTAVAQNGTVASPGGFAIVTNTQHQRNPAIAYFASKYWVVWQTGYIQGATVTPAGVVTMLGNLSTSRSATTPDIATDGSNFLVAFESTQDIRGVMVSSAGVPGTEFAIESAAGAQRYPKIAWDGTSHYQVVYENDQSFSTNGTDITTRRVSPAAAVLAAVPVAASANHELGPSITGRTFGGVEVAYWRGTATTPFEYDVIGQSISVGALSGASFTIANAAKVREMTPAIACVSTTSCITAYRSFDTTEDVAEIDRIRARVLTY